MVAATGAASAMTPRTTMIAPWNRNSRQWAARASLIARCMSLRMGSTEAMGLLRLSAFAGLGCVRWTDGPAPCAQPFRSLRCRGGRPCLPAAPTPASACIFEWRNRPEGLLGGAIEHEFPVDQLHLAHWYHDILPSYPQQATAPAHRLHHPFVRPAA